VFGDQFWRPYIHMRYAARAIRTVPEAPVENATSDKIRAEFGLATVLTVPDGIAEPISPLDESRFGDPFAKRYRNVPCALSE
jgi:hypothetical protein